MELAYVYMVRDCDGLLQVGYSQDIDHVKKEAGESLVFHEVYSSLADAVRVTKKLVRATQEERQLVAGATWQRIEGSWHVTDYKKGNGSNSSVEIN